MFCFVLVWFGLVWFGRVWFDSLFLFVSLLISLFVIRFLSKQINQNSKDRGTSLSKQEIKLQRTAAFIKDGRHLTSVCYMGNALTERII